MGYKIPGEPDRTPDEEYPIEPYSGDMRREIEQPGEDWRFTYNANNQISNAVIIASGREIGRLIFHYDAAGLLVQVEKSGEFSEKTLYCVLDAVYQVAFTALATLTARLQVRNALNVWNDVGWFGGNVTVPVIDAGVNARLDINLSTRASQATLALLNAKLNSLITGELTTSLDRVNGTLQTARNWSLDFANLDISLSALRNDVQPWFERNSTPNPVNWSFNIPGATGWTTVLVYTVPANHRAIVQSGWVSVKATAAIDQQQTAILTYQNGGITEVRLIQLGSVTTHSANAAFANGTVMLKVDDTVRIAYANADPAAHIGYAHITIWEFDAP